MRLDGFTQPTLFPVSFLVQQILGIPAAAYAFERELGELHPDNRNIKAKIRQQLRCDKSAASGDCRELFPTGCTGFTGCFPQSCPFC